MDCAAGHRHSCARLTQIAIWSIRKDQDSLFLDTVYVVNLFFFVKCVIEANKMGIAFASPNNL